MKPLKKITGKIVFLNIGSTDTEDYVKAATTSATLELDGFVGDRHKGFSRECWAGDKEPEGTIRRNERQWSGMSIEELAIIQSNMDLKEELTGSDLAVNIGFEGIPDYSQLPKGTIFTFPSGAKLVSVEYNPPCADMGEALAEKYTTNSGKALTRTTFPVAGIGLRGLVGIVDVPGDIHVGDEVIAEIWDENCQMNKPRS